MRAAVRNVLLTQWPSFWVPFNDLGSGVVNLAPARAVGSNVATFTRASTAYTRLANGTYTLVASGSPRSYYLPVGVYGGYLAEGARADVLGTTDAIRRTMTDVGWVSGGGGIAVGAAVGADGAANAGASLTAGGANGTILFTTVLGAAVRTYSAWVRRKTGTGTVNITGDNGATWTAITLTTAYQQFQFTTASAANPVVGFRIVTNTDAIEVDFNTLEAATFANPTPIPVNVSKAADVLTYPSAGNIVSTVGASYAEVAPIGNQEIDSANPRVIDVTNGSAAPLILSAASQPRVYDGTTLASSGLATLSYNAVGKIASNWDGSSMQAFSAGIAGSAQSFDGSMNADRIQIGTVGGAAGSIAFGAIRNVRIYPVALSASKLQAMTT